MQGAQREQPARTRRRPARLATGAKYHIYLSSCYILLLSPLCVVPCRGNFADMRVVVGLI